MEVVAVKQRSMKVIIIPNLLLKLKEGFFRKNTLKSN